MSFQLKPITNDIEHEAALERFEFLLNATQDSPEAYERDVLAILIEKYEDETIHIPLPDPIEAIKFRLEQAGLTRKALEPILGGRAKVSEIMSGKREFTIKMARGLHLQLGIPAESLLSNPTILHDEWADIDFDRFPVVEMERNGAFKQLGLHDIKDRAEEAIRLLVDSFGGTKSIPQGLFRKSASSRLNANLDLYALKGWCFQVLSMAKMIAAPSFQPDMLNSDFLKNLVHLSTVKDGPKKAQAELLKVGIVLVIVPHLKKTYLDGAAFMTEDGRAIIGITIRHDRLDNFWFALLHEIGHIVRHLNGKPGDFLVDDLSLRGSQSDSEIELQADKFAESALLPENFDLHTKEFITAFDVLSYAQEIGVSPSIVAGRIQHKKQNYHIFANLVGRGEVMKQFIE